MASSESLIKKNVEEFLDERWLILNMYTPPRPADLAYYNGVLATVEKFNYSWTRDNDGKHKIWKRS